MTKRNSACEKPEGPEAETRTGSVWEGDRPALISSHLHGYLQLKQWAADSRTAILPAGPSAGLSPASFSLIRQGTPDGLSNPAPSLYPHRFSVCEWAWASHGTSCAFLLAWLLRMTSADRCSPAPSASILILKLCQAVQGQSQWEAFPGQHLAAWQGMVGICQPRMNSGFLSCLRCQSSQRQLTYHVVMGERGTLSSLCTWSRTKSGG